MTVRVLAFARVREILGSNDSTLTLNDGARVSDAWAAVVERAPALAPLARSTRVARNGEIVSGEEPLQDGDELALLPPSGGG